MEAAMATWWSVPAWEAHIKASSADVKLAASTAPEMTAAIAWNGLADERR
jgi:hypothetical protein